MQQVVEDRCQGVAGTAFRLVLQTGTCGQALEEPSIADI